jgi:hypothetical protein
VLIANLKKNKMADQDQDSNNNNQEKTFTQADLDAQLAETKKTLEETLKAEMKNKLDGAYSARDEALRKAAEAEQKTKELEIQQLKEAGKVKEALEAELAQERARRVTLEQKNVELSRDSLVRDSLSGLDFRNAKAASLAFKEIVGNLTQDATGNWVAKNGKSVAEFVAEFAKDPEQEFLFKPSSNNGNADTGGNTNNSALKKGAKLSEMTQEKVLEMALAGTLPGQKPKP